ncbi:MAG: TetR family transcriptional regulator [Alteromonas sp.]|jgi:AcrR family transcriptional regulator|uniref:TetR family transcriptional regulator n=1 Tax=Paraglaciecola chathamensis TaxID=368405 RepID=A0A8H9IIJ7_9ALTE|nr:TetR/AcrR family transcriptional regulator [Paraglaciecola oceanifecundans]MAI64624.1 TetR family transcriptional regulator [Alteromonas sp.]GGZ83993.1 TetR family transcriptional regulator [Paraglaciecola oceanifecundans]|tara:strand:+ start:120 stop:713 length:594 start_codon:yes stop_codon:yes gene_type:complete
MAIKVDKHKKRRDIAGACTELLLEKGIKNLTITEIAKTAGIGKGTVYDYFSNKEEIVFEIIRKFIEEHHNYLLSQSDKQTSTKQKVLYLFDFFLSDYKPYEKHLDVYREYLSVTLSSKCSPMAEFNRECSGFIRNILEDIINEGIEKGEIKDVARHLIDGLMKAERGYMVIAWAEGRDLKQEFKDYIDTLFDLIEVK